MSTFHYVPLIVEQNGDIHSATDKELLEYKTKNPRGYARWTTANRITMGKKLISDGTPSNFAWAKAFEQYPDESKSAKPRFVYTK